MIFRKHKKFSPSTPGDTIEINWRNEIIQFTKGLVMKAV